MRIAILGVMGSGKSTLAEELANYLNFDYVPEPYQENPYIPNYIKTGENAFSCQMAMLALWHKVWSKADTEFMHDGEINWVVDGHPLLSAEVFTEMAHYRGQLTAEDVRLVKVCYEMMRKRCEVDLAVFLSATPDTLLQRIRRRGRDFEVDVNAHTLGVLHSYYMKATEDYLLPKVVIETDKLTPKQVMGRALQAVEVCLSNKKR